MNTILQTRSNANTNKNFLESMLSPSADFGGLYTFGAIRQIEGFQKEKNITSSPCERRSEGEASNLDSQKEIKLNTQKDSSGIHPHNDVISTSQNDEFLDSYNDDLRHVERSETSVKFNKDSSALNQNNNNKDTTFKTTVMLSNGETSLESKENKKQNLDSILKLDYKNMCKAIFKHLSIELDESMLDYALSSYDNFRSKDIIPLAKITQNLYCLELYHGPTFAFKDMALQPFSRLLDKIAQSRGEKYLILSATSGDTGPATLSAFANLNHIKAICIYPHGGTSDVQRLQMTTQDSKNLKVFGIRGDFDLAQSTLKSLLKDKDFIESVDKSGYKLSAANSVNIARIAFQIPYYFAIAKSLQNEGIDEFDVVIPSGNFGNALGGFFAKKLGLSINKICIASNPNDILTEFFTTGIYDIRHKKLHLSYSPAMDILKSSNIERLLFEYFGADRTRFFMESLDKNMYFSLEKDELKILQDTFEASSFSDSQCLNGIRESYLNHSYLIEPHTSNAYLFAKQRKGKVQVILSTAHFSKFAKPTFKALSNEDIYGSDLEILKKISEMTKADVDDEIMNLFKKTEIHSQIYDAKDIGREIISWIKQ